MASKKKKNSKFNFVKKIKKNPWKLTTFIFGVLAIFLLGTLIISDSSLSSKQAGESFVDYINSMGAAKIEYVDSATLGKAGVRKSSPMANMDFIVVPLAKYFKNHLIFGKDLTQCPRVFSTNYFLKGQETDSGFVVFIYN